jgi:hypothetical protein
MVLSHHRNWCEVARWNHKLDSMKNIKKSIDTRSQNSVSPRKVLKQTKDFCPVGFFVCSDPSKKIKNNQTRPGKRKNTSMYSLNQVNKLVSCGRDPARSLPFWRGFLLIPLILVCFAVAPKTQAVSPAPDGAYPGFNTAEGDHALFLLFGGFGNTANGWYSNFAAVGASFNTGDGAGTLTLNTGDANTAVGTAALILNGAGGQNVAVGAGAMVNNAGDATTFDGFYSDAVGAFALNANVTGFSNNAVGNAALVSNINAANNTAVGDIALAFNDVTGAAMANNNVAVGGGALVSADATTGNIDGSENTAVGAGAGPNLVSGFNNTYLGNFVGSTAGDEDSTIRIGDLSQGAGSVNCYIGGIATQEQPVSDTVAVVTVDLTNDHLGWATLAGAAAHAPQRAVPTRRGRVQPTARPGTQHQTMLDKKVQTLEATVGQQQQEIAQQQKQIDTLTGQLNQQAEQIQKVSAQLEMIRPTPRVVNNQ